MQVFDGIAINCNNYILWANNSCGKYTAKNINESRFDVVITIQNTALTFFKELTIKYGESALIDLPNDGFYEVVVESEESPLIPFVGHGFLFETCNLYACLDKIVMAAYNLDIVSCKCGKCKQCKTPKADKMKQQDQLNTAFKINAVWIDIITSYASYTSISQRVRMSPEEANAVIAKIDMKFNALRGFLLSCGESDCAEKKPCKKKETANCGCVL